MKRKHIMKRIIAFVMVGFILTFTGPATETEALLQVGIYGDVDGDGKVSARDALTTLKHAANIIVLKGDQYTKADYDGNLIVNADDALLILKKVAKLI